MVRAEVTCRPVPVFKGRHGNTPVQNLTPHILKLPVDKGSQRFKPFLSGNRGLLRDFLILDRYGNQMLYYKAALEQILGKRVSESYLYSFSLKKFIPVNLQERSGENA